MDAPWWAFAIPNGVFFAAGLAVLPALEQGHRPRVADIVGGVIGGAFFGVVMGRWAVHHRNAARAALGERENGRERLTGRAAVRGSMPTDPEARAAAARLLTFYSDTMARQRRWAPAMFSVLIAVAVVDAVPRSPWWWAAVALFALFLIGTIVMPVHLERRLHDLESRRSR